MSQLRHYYVQERIKINGRERILWTSDAMSKTEAITYKKLAESDKSEPTTFHIVRDYED